jgi:hypothetical protein
MVLISVYHFRLSFVILEARTDTATTEEMVGPFPEYFHAYH